MSWVPEEITAREEEIIMHEEQVVATSGATGKAKKPMGKLTFAVLFVIVFAAVMVFFNIITGGTFLDWLNIKVIISHAIYPAFIAWGLCFLFACGYTDMSLGGVIVLGSFASCVLGNWIGYPGVIIGGVVMGLILVFINFNIFAFTNIPSWIAGISLGLIYEAVAVMLKVDPVTKPLIDVQLNMEYRGLGQLPWSVIILLVALVIIYFIYNRTTVGLNIRALGGNKEVAKGMGINVTRTLLAVGILCGLMIGVGCVLQESLNGRTTVKTGLTSMNLVFQPMAIVLLSQILQKKINIIIAVPICAFIIYSVFNVLTILGVPSGTLQEACLGGFLIIFGVVGQWGHKGVVK